MPRPLRLILLVYLALGLVYALATPPFEASDEVFHYPFVRNIALGKGLPVQKLDVHQPWEQVAFHPPAYHILSAALTFWIDTSDFDSLRAANPFARIGIPGAPQNVNYTRAAARAIVEPFVFHGSALAIYIIRLLSLFLGVCTVTLTYFFVSTLSPSSVESTSRRERGPGGEAILATCLLAFNPTFLFISASVNNDSLTWLTAVAALFVAVHLMRGPSQFIKREIGDLRLDIPTVGVLLGIAALAKVSALILTPIVGLALLAQAARTRNWQRFFVNGTIIVGLVALIAGWWYVRNLILYNELLALNIFGQFTAARLEPYTLATFFSEWPSFWLSFWGMFGSFNIMASGWVYSFFTALTFAGIVGGVWRLIRNRDAILKQGRWHWLTHGLLILFIAVTAVSLLRWNLLNYAAQGRLMFTALAPLMMYLAAGLLSWIPRRFAMRFVGALAGVLGFIALYVAVNDVAAAYLPPAPLAESQLPTTLRPINARLAPGAELIGYTLDSPDLTAPNNQLLITLYWRALSTMDKDYNLFLHILGQSRALVGSVDTWPGGGLRPTSFWKTGEIYQDSYVIQLDPDAATPSQLWLDLAMWETDPGYPIQITGPDSAPIPSVIVPVGRIDSPQSVAATPEKLVGTTLEGGITLIGFDLPESPITNQPITLSLYWQTSEPLPADYTVFIHLIDANGQQFAADGPPLNGDWPTSAWQPNRLVIDPHTLVFPAPGEYAIRVGLYDPATVIPLAAFRADGSEWPDRAIELMTVSVK
ncbi:MAG: hypothetical protein HYZ49_03495 [Chloroflexi bacterium]|nr:hypothetical protein [Chloroflexota bacterium]